MPDICNQFAKNNHVTFDTERPNIKYGNAVKPQEYAKLNDTLLSMENNVRHLGIFL